MNNAPVIEIDYHQISLANQRWGVLFGLIMGLAFAAGAWGVDGYALSQTSVDFPWLRLVAGLALSLPIAILAGWLTGLSDNGFMSALIWSLASAASLWIAGHVPYEISSQVIRWLDPNFKSLEVYPFPDSAATRLGLGITVGIVLALISGGLGAMAVDSLRLKVGFSRVSVALVCSILMLLAGLFSDTITNRPLRVPVVEIDRLIELYRSYQGKTITPLESRQLRFGTVKPMTGEITQPHRLVLGDYQTDTLESARVYVNFGETWYRCWVIADQPSFCQKSEDVYSKAFTCLWQSGEKCGALTDDSVLTWIEQNNQEQEITTRVFAQRGFYTLIHVGLDSQDLFECRFRDSGSLRLESCAASPSAIANVPSATANVQPTATYTPVPEEQDDWRVAVVPENWDTVEALENLPRYSIEVELDSSGTSYRGSMTLAYTNTETVRLDELLLRLLPNGGKSYGEGSLDIIPPVTVSGQQVDANIQAADRTSFLIPIPGGLEPGASIDVMLSFRGQVPLDFGGKENTSAYGLYNFTRNVLTLANWYPILAVYEEQGWRTDMVSSIGDSVYSEVAFYEVAITAPVDWVVAATGIQVGEERSEGITRHEFISGPERDFFIAASPDFTIVSKPVGETTVHSYSLPGSEPGGEDALQVGTRSLEIYNRQFGQYPSTELDIVEAPMRNAGGVEFPGIVLIESSRYKVAKSDAFITTVAHEVAHMWWYSVVGNDIFTDPWLDEALTTYSSILYYEFTNGSQAYNGLRDFYQQRYERLVDSGNDDRVANSLTYFENEHPERYGPVVYSKGALFFGAVREEIGDKAFFEALRDYYQKKQYQVAKPDDLLSAFERASGGNLDDLYQEWLYEP